MELKEPILILSDLHLGHPATRVRKAEQLKELFEGVGTVVFNGDTMEMWPRELRDKSRRLFDEVAELVRECGADAVFINGNHDACLSEVNHLDLADGAALVTHGDILFRYISPWSREAPLVSAEMDRVLEELAEDDFASLEKRLVATKKASLVLEMHESLLPSGRWSWMRTFFREAWPPWRPLKIFRCWAQTPGFAEGFVRVFRPQARFVIIGHTHYAGVWRRGPRVVINTGSFISFSGTQGVLLAGEEIEVRSIRMKQGRFAFGRSRAKFPVRVLQAVDGF